MQQWYECVRTRWAEAEDVTTQVTTWTVERLHEELLKYSKTLKKPQIQPPEMIGRVRLSSREPRSIMSKYQNVNHINENT